MLGDGKTGEYAVFAMIQAGIHLVEPPASGLQPISRTSEGSVTFRGSVKEGASEK